MITGLVIGAIFMFALGYLASEVMNSVERRKNPRSTEFRVLNRRAR